MKQDYSKTLNLPQTKFEMRGNLPQKEPATLEKWEEMNLYEKIMDKNEGKPLYILHDGPPYANGDIHLGHALNKTLKDILVKYRNMNGFKSPYIPGWDTHGLPIEQKVIKKHGINRHEMSPVEFRRECRDFALGYVDIQREQFKRLGILAQWDNPYVTLDPVYESKQVEIFGEMAKKGYIYKGLKPVYWCADCETALAEAEIEYAEDKNASIYVKFPIKDDKGKLKDFTQDTTPYAVIWTTTTWTLPGNMAICLNGEIEYSLIKVDNESYIIATELVENVMKAAGIEQFQELKKYKGSELEGITYSHVFLDRISPIILGEHVTLEAGTGCVHTAPGHGVDDFIVGKKYDIDVVVPVNAKGHLTKDAGIFEGLYYKKANEEIRKYLAENNYLLSVQNIMHQYPHCWRCKSPILFRATEQWFASIDGFREKAIDAVASVKWVPEWGEERIKSMISDRGDWCISRQRIWGVPIPIFYCNDCGKELINDETITIVSKLFKERGSDAWFELEAKDILTANIKCECGGKEFSKEMDIMDVWFDSGSSHASVLETRDNLRWPADIYLEGNDQYRGWFQSSLLTSIAAKGIAPYKEVLTHGFLVDGDGKKMSKSLGNGIEPHKVADEFGADILRLWVVSADYKTDIKISNEILKQTAEVYKKIRNTSRFILGNLYDFDPNKDYVPYNNLFEIDKWALLQLNKFVGIINNSFEAYDFNSVYREINNFCIVQMSNIYLDIIKDRLYTELANSHERRAAQTVMFEVINALVRLISPILSFTSEEIWSIMPHKDTDNLESVHLNDWARVEPKYKDENLENKWKKILEIRSDVLKGLEIARNDKIIGNSLMAEVDIYTGKENRDFLDTFNDLEKIFIVSKANVLPIEQAPNESYESKYDKDIKLLIKTSTGNKCERCWNYTEEVGGNEEHPELCGRCVDVVGSL